MIGCVCVSEGEPGHSVSGPSDPLPVSGSSACPYDDHETFVVEDNLLFVRR